MSERFYVLSEIADKDLEEIFDYSVHQFGFEQAEKYFLEIEDVFQSLILNPYSGRKRDENKTGFIQFSKRQPYHFLQDYG